MVADDLVCFLNVNALKHQRQGLLRLRKLHIVTCGPSAVSLAADSPFCSKLITPGDCFRASRKVHLYVFHVV